MAKFYGNIGFVTFNEATPGNYEEVIEDKIYTGDVLRNSRRFDDMGHDSGSNASVLQNTRVSIIINDFALANVAAIRYVEMYGTKWRVEFVEVEPPRIVLKLGGVYV